MSCGHSLGPKIGESNRMNQQLNHGIGESNRMNQWPVKISYRKRLFPRFPRLILFKNAIRFPKITLPVKTSTVPRHIPNFQAGKVETQSSLAENGPTPAENPRSVQKTGCQKRRIAGPKREITMFKVGGRLNCPRAYPANLSALYSVLIMKYQSDPSDLCRNRENRVKTGVFWVGDFHDLATWRLNNSHTNASMEI